MQGVEKPASDPIKLQPPAAAAAHHVYELLLRIEADARRVESVGELRFLIANETMKLTKARQIFVLSVPKGVFKVETVSSIGAVDRNAPRIRFIEGVIRQLSREAGLAKIKAFTLPAYCPPGEIEQDSYPFRFMAWVPFQLRDGHIFAGMLLARETPWPEADLLLAERLAETYSHAWRALSGPRRLKRNLPIKPLIGTALLLAIAAMFIPVHMTVLAPSEVVPVAPEIVAAPLDGAIEEVLVNPNASVVKGQPLFRLADTALRNELRVAEQDVKVAQAKLMQISQRAIADPEARRDLAVTRSELSVASAKRDYAADMLARTSVKAETDGVVIFTDKRDWIGRPVSIGERVMEVADPSRVQLRIDVPVADAIAVENGAAVSAFLDADPLHPVAAKTLSSSFDPQMIEGNILAYRIYAGFDAVPERGLRLGIRGTSQIFGEKVPLAYYLFRRPIAAIRQRLGL
jgi:hypothetical protein